MNLKTKITDLQKSEVKRWAKSMADIILPSIVGIDPAAAVKAVERETQRLKTALYSAGYNATVECNKSKP